MPLIFTNHKDINDGVSLEIYQEVRKIIDEAYQRTLNLLKSKRNELEIIAQELLTKEVLFQNDLERLIGKRPFLEDTTYKAFMNKPDAPQQVAKLTEDASNEEVKKSILNKTIIRSDSILGRSFCWTNNLVYSMYYM